MPQKQFLIIIFDVPTALIALVTLEILIRFKIPEPISYSLLESPDCSFFAARSEFC